MSGFLKTKDLHASIMPSTQDSSVMSLRYLRRKSKRPMRRSSDQMGPSQITSTSDQEEVFYQRQGYLVKKAQPRQQKILTISKRTDSSGGTNNELVLFSDRRVSANQDRFRLPELKKRHYSIAELGFEKKIRKSVSEQCLSTLEGTLKSQAFKPIKELLQKARDMVRQDVELQNRKFFTRR